MVINNIKDLLIKSLNKVAKQETVIKSIIWNTLIETYQTKKNIDITPYLVSIQLKNNICIIHTWKPILNTDLQLYESFFKETLQNRFQKTGIIIKNIEFRYK